MLASLVIVFREVIEAGSDRRHRAGGHRGVPGRGRSVAFGVVARRAGRLPGRGLRRRTGSLFQGSGQELFNAAILLLAVGMLTWHNVWMASHGREMARELKAVGTRSGRRRAHR